MKLILKICIVDNPHWILLYLMFVFQTQIVLCYLKQREWLRIFLSYLGTKLSQTTTDPAVVIFIIMITLLRPSPPSLSSFCVSDFYSPRFHLSLEMRASLLMLFSAGQITMLWGVRQRSLKLSNTAYFSSLLFSQSPSVV